MGDSGCRQRRVVPECHNTSQHAWYHLVVCTRVPLAGRACAGHAHDVCACGAELLLTYFTKASRSYGYSHGSASRGRRVSGHHATASESHHTKPLPCRHLVAGRRYCYSRVLQPQRQLQRHHRSRHRNTRGRGRSNSNNDKWEQQAPRRSARTTSFATRPPIFSGRRRSCGLRRRTWVVT